MSSLTRSRPIIPLLLRLVLVQCHARLHGDKRRGAGLEPRGDTTERLALAALLLVFARAEERFVPCGVYGERRAAVGLDGEDVRLECERVDELEWTCVRKRPTVRGIRTYVCVYAFGEWVDVGRELYLSIVEGGSEKLALEKSASVLVRQRVGLPTCFGTRRLGDWINGTRDAAAY